MATDQDIDSFIADFQKSMQPDVPQVSDFISEILQSRNPNAPVRGGNFDISQIGSDIYRDVSRATDIPQGLAGIPRQIGDTANLIGADPLRALKSLGVAAVQGTSNLLQAPGEARDYFVSRGIAPESTPSFRPPEWLANRNVDFRDYYGLGEQQTGEDLLQGVGRSIPPALAATLTGGATLPLWMGAESAGGGEGPLLPALLAFLGQKTVKEVKGASPTLTAKDVTARYRQGQKYFNTQYDKVFNAKGVPQQAPMPLNIIDIDKLSKLAPGYVENLLEYATNKNPKALQQAISGLERLKADTISEGVRASPSAIKATEIANKLLPKMNQTLETAIKRGGNKNWDRYQKIQQKYKKDMVPIHQDLRNAIRTYEQGLGSPLSVVESAKGSPRDMFKQRYGGEIAGLKRVKSDSFLENVIKNPYFYGPTGAVTGSALFSGGRSLLDEIRDQIRGGE